MELSRSYLSVPAEQTRGVPHSGQQAQVETRFPFVLRYSTLALRSLLITTKPR